MDIWKRFRQVLRLLRDLKAITDGYPQLRKVLDEGEEFLVLLASSAGKPYTHKIQVRLRAELHDAYKALDNVLRDYPTIDRHPTTD